jgi:hypothetical protein
MLHDCQKAGEAGKHGAGSMEPSLEKRKVAAVSGLALRLALRA